MATIKQNLADAGQAVVDTTKSAGKAIAEGASQATDYVKEKTGMAPKEGTNAGISAITEHMNVIASCGKKVGVVDHFEGNTIKLTKNDSPDGLHHYIPVAWVDHVDSHVHLTKNSVETEQGWKSDSASCGCS